jgi:hypothetical protein
MKDMALSKSGCPPMLSCNAGCFGVASLLSYLRGTDDVKIKFFAFAYG